MFLVCYQCQNLEHFQSQQLFFVMSKAAIICIKIAFGSFTYVSFHCLLIYIWAEINSFLHTSFGIQIQILSVFFFMFRFLGQHHSQHIKLFKTNFKDFFESINLLFLKDEFRIEPWNAHKKNFKQIRGKEYYLGNRSS